MSSKINKTSNIIIKFLTIIFLLEPLWMLLPFAGFLYGSILNLNFFYENPYMAWLVYHIFPVQTLFPIAMALTFIGGIIFIIGAVQIYTAKIFKKGLVKNGIYKKFRHPQYTGLIIFCIGFLLLWGRFLTYILFVTMFFIYYFLAKKEEIICLELFGKEYEEYMKKSYLIFPGEKIFNGISDYYNSLISKLPNKIIRITITYLLLLFIVILSGFSILKIRSQKMNYIPFIKEHIKEDNKELDFIIIKGYEKCLNNVNNSFYNHLIKSMMGSNIIKQALKKFNKSVNTIFIYGISRTIREKKEYYKEGKIDLFAVLIDSKIKLDENNFSEYRKNWEIKGAIEISKVDIKDISNTSNITFNNILEVDSIQNIKNFTNGYLYGIKNKLVPIHKLIEK